jgi:hypothetical protein
VLSGFLLGLFDMHLSMLLLPADRLLIPADTAEHPRPDPKRPVFTTILVDLNGGDRIDPANEALHYALWHPCIWPGISLLQTEHLFDFTRRSLPPSVLTDDPVRLLAGVISHLHLSMLR